MENLYSSKNILKLCETNMSEYEDYSNWVVRELRESQEGYTIQEMIEEFPVYEIMDSFLTIAVKYPTYIIQVFGDITMYDAMLKETPELQNEVFARPDICCVNCMVSKDVSQFMSQPFFVRCCGINLEERIKIKNRIIDFYESCRIRTEISVGVLPVTFSLAKVDEATNNYRISND